MGRPLNPRHFAAEGVGPTAAGNEIKVNFHNGTAVKEGYIIKQTGSKKFKVEEIGTSGVFECTLTWDALPATLTSGEMSISVQMDDSETYLIKKIAGRCATLNAPSGTGSNAYDGLKVAWAYGAAAAAADSTARAFGKIEEAGDDNILVGTDDDDFTDDA